MNARTLTIGTLVFYAACAVGPTVGAVACWKQWQAAHATRTLLQRGPSLTPGQAADRLAGIERTKASLLREQAAKSDRLAALTARQLPATAQAARQSTLDVLALAERCGLLVEEVARPGEARRGETGETYAVAAPAGQDAAAAFLNRFSPNPSARRPLVQLRGRGEYAALHQFFAGLNALSWPPTLVQFDLEQDRSEAESQTLRLDVTFAL